MTITNRRLKILGFEGWDGGSHAQVRRSITAHSRHEWQWFTRPARAWKWRLRTGAVDLAAQVVADDCSQMRPDLIFTTSMISTGDLRSLLPERLRTVPVVLYMHENQAAYPFRHQDDMQGRRDHHFAITNMTSCLSADRVLWNSRWNRDSFLSGIRSLLDKSPDQTCSRSVKEIMDRSMICWPPVERSSVPEEVLHNRPEANNSGRSISGAQIASGDGCVRVVWPHRWEHDKGPDTLLRLARYLRHRSPGRYRWIILGERFKTVPPAMDQFLREFDDDIDHAGWVESREAYWSWLGAGDWVLSTARHEFFGIAVIEAMLAGCLPWLPRRLSYPEIVPERAMRLSPFRQDPDVEEIRREIISRLEATRPDRAVSLLDDEIESLASSNRP